MLLVIIAIGVALVGTGFLLGMWLGWHDGVQAGRAEALDEQIDAVRDLALSFFTDVYAMPRCPDTVPADWSRQGWL